MADPSIRFLEPGVQAKFDASRIAVLPVPFEATVTYGSGTRGGPEGILRASAELELFDERTRIQPHQAGIWTAPLLQPQPESMPEDVQGEVGRLMDAGKWVVMLGGEHSITPAAVRAAAARVPGLHVVQLDAHADLRDTYLGSPWNHACAMARCLEVAPVRAFGIRSYSAAEARRMDGEPIDYGIVHAWEMSADDGWLHAVESLAGRPVYLTVDVDYFDPSLVPATGTPEPGGPGWRLTQRLLDRLFEVADVVACDAVELAPTPGLHHADFTVARLVHELVGRAALRHGWTADTADTKS
ncbi:MAG: agmatinase [bacterium]|nr:agmatinase [bacterium]